MTTVPDDPLPLPLDEPRGLRRVWCSVCGRKLTGRLARLRGVGDDCWAKLAERTAPKPPAHTVEQDTIPGV